jgi:diguanylate cyclase (GGDEF)-like protein
MPFFRKDGSQFWSDLSVAPVRDATDRITHYVAVIEDITERKRYEQELEYQATHDALTGLANRNMLFDRLGQSLIFARRSQRIVAILLLDLDRFKGINDSLGHSRGDELLHLIAERLNNCVRPGDTVSRLGGDEFVITLAEVAELDDVGLTAQRIRNRLAEPFRVAGHELRVSASIGISLYPKDGDTVESLIRHADLAMYRAKEQGGDTFRFFAPEMNQRAQGTLKLEADLRLALQRGEFFLHYQPRIDIASDRIIGCEALVRWQHPQRGMVPPGVFIPLAEETGLIEPLSDWVLRAACTQARAWRDEGLPSLPVAVNLSNRQFRHVGLIDQVQTILAESDLAPATLDLELTESMIMHDPARAADTMRCLKQIGVGLCLDDFGTGYSSLNYLRRFPVDYLKIDRSFINDVASDPSGAAVTRSIVAIAHSLGIGAVAEGVETWEQYNFLTASRCNALQGFLFSKPLPPANFSRLLRESRALCPPVGPGRGESHLSTLESKGKNPFAWPQDVPQLEAFQTKPQE